MLNKNILLGFIIILSVLLGIGAGSLLFQNKEVKDNIISGQITRTVPIVGVTSEGMGVVGLMTVEVKPGSGLVLVNINELLADYESQLSARNAALIAQNITKKSLYNKDIIYKLEVNASVVSGPSAGLAMAIATIAALEDKTIKDGVFMTGAVSSEGKITGVGGIDKKAEAAKSGGAKIFVIPKGNHIGNYERNKNCKTIDDFEYCEILYLPDENGLSKLYNITILEAGDITEVLSEVIE